MAKPLSACYCKISFVKTSSFSFFIGQTSSFYLSMASTTKKKPPIVWSSLTEHAIKISLYTAFVIHAVLSPHRSTTAFSYVANTLILPLALWMVKGEVNVFIKRLRRQLPPGFLGFPIHREIKLITDYVLIRQGLKDKRRWYGTFYTQFFLGRPSSCVMDRMT